MPDPVSLTSHCVDACTRAAWQTQLAVAKKTPGLLPSLVRYRNDLLPRFAVIYQHLRAQPRRARRRLQRRWPQSLAGVALALALGQGAVWADAINVDGTTCALIEAIVTANTDSDTEGLCADTRSYCRGGHDRVTAQQRAYTHCRT